jgi:hypothetical protein
MAKGKYYFDQKLNINYNFVILLNYSYVSTVKHTRLAVKKISIIYFIPLNLTILK